MIAIWSDSFVSRSHVAWTLNQPSCLLNWHFQLGGFTMATATTPLAFPFDRWWWSCGKGQTWYWTSELNRAAHALSSVITSPQALLEALKCPDYGHIADLQHVTSEIANSLWHVIGDHKDTNQYKYIIINHQSLSNELGKIYWILASDQHIHCSLSQLQLTSCWGPNKTCLPVVPNFTLVQEPWYFLPKHCVLHAVCGFGLPQQPHNWHSFWPLVMKLWQRTDLVLDLWTEPSSSCTVQCYYQPTSTPWSTQMPWLWTYCRSSARDEWNSQPRFGMWLETTKTQINTNI